MLVLLTTLASKAQLTRVNEDFNVSMTPLGWANALNAGPILSRVTTVQSFGRAGTTAAIRSNCYNDPAMGGSRATLETNVFNASVSGDSLRFDVAHAAYSSVEHDSLIVYAYNGTSYSRIGFWGSSTIIDLTGITTAVAMTGEFIPTSAQWLTKRLVLPVGTTRVQFEFYSDYGNQMYIDRVMVDSSVVQTYTSSTTTQTNTSPILQGATNQEIIGMQVVMNGNNPLLSVTDFLLSTGTSTNPATDILTAKLYYSGTSSVFSTSTLYGSASAPNGVFTISGSAALAHGTNYFWLVYDISATAGNANTIDATCDGITINAIVRTPTVQSPTGSRAISVPFQVQVSASSGTTIGTYATLKEAIDKINDGTHQGVIDIRVHGSTTELAGSTLARSGAASGAIYTAVTLRPADTATVAKVISLNVTGTSVLILDGADNITIDGRPGGVGSNRLLTLTNLSNTNLSNTIVLQNDATNNLFAYTNLMNARNNTNATRTTVASVVYFGNASSSISNSNNTFNYNILTGGNMGINFNGTSLTNPADNIVIRGNQFNSQVVTCIRMDTMVKNVTIDSNFFSHPTAVATNGFQAINISHIHPTGTITITRNRVFNINTSTANFAQGIIFSPLTASGTLIIRNNSIVIGSTALPNTLSQIIRCFLFGGTQAATVTVEHNTFRIGGTHVTLNGNPTTVGALKSNSSVSTVFTFKNNLCINTRTGTANQHVGAFFSTPTTGTNSIDYNTYQGGGTFTTAWIGTFYSSITSYKAIATPNEQNSSFGILDFVNTTDPDLLAVSTNNTGAKLVGTTSTVTDDIYGTLRSGSTPYKGAFEGSAATISNQTNDLQVVIVYTYGKIPIGTTDTIRATIRNLGAAPAVNIPVYLHSSLSGLIGSVNVSLGIGSETIINLAPYIPSILGFDTLRAFPQPDQFAPNDTFLWVRENTLNALSYSRPFLNQTGNVGTNPQGEIVAKFTTPVPNFVNQVNVNFTTAGVFTSNPFQIVIYPDSGGALGPKFNPIYVSATQNTVNGIFNLSLPSVPVSGSFYLGVRQTSANNIGFAYQNENPIRNNTFYFRQGATYPLLAWNDFAVNPTNQYRFMIEPRLKINDDLGIIDVLSPSIGCSDTNSTKQVRVTVQNLGLLAQNFSTSNLQVFGRITNPANITTSFGPITINSGVLNSDDTLSVVLAPSYNMGATGNYTIKAWSQYALDNNKVNDTLPNTVRIVTIPATVPYSQTFNAALTFPVEMTTNRFFVQTGIGTNGTNAVRVDLFNTDPFSANAQIVLPRLAVTALTQCRFEYKITNFTGGAATVLTNVDSMNIYVSTDCGYSYTKVQTIVGSSHTPSTNYSTLSIPLASYAGQNIRIKIQFDWFGTTNDANVDIDNIRVIEVTNDLSAISTSQPCRAILLGSGPVIPQAVFMNTGSTSLATGTTVNYVITGPTSYSGTATLSATTPGNFATAIFSPAFTPTAIGNYSVKIFSSLSTDSDHLNDTLLYAFSVINTTQTNAGNALVFGGAAAAQVANSPTVNLASNSFSIEAWILKDAAGTGNRVILSKDTTVVIGQYAFWINLSENLIFTVNTSITGPTALVSTNTVPAGVYTHIAAIYDGTTVKLYMNGVLEASALQSGTVVPNSLPLNIGQKYDATEKFVGRIDELKIWNTAITEHDLRTKMHTRLANSPSVNLMAYYRMDEGSGTLSADASGNCNTLVFGTGTAPTWAVATYPLTATPVNAMQQILTDGIYPFTNTNITLTITGVTTTGDSIYLHKFSGAPIGTSPLTSPGGVTAIHGNYWIAYKYGSGNYTNVDLSSTFGPGNLVSGVVAADLKLFSRASGASGAWTALATSATTVSFASQSASFSSTANNMFNKQLIVGGNNNPLPVKLLFFTAKNNNGNVDLTWATASEIDNAGFHIERSLDGTHFTEISFVKGKGNSNKRNNYLSNDPKAFVVAGSQKLYYRLVQTDFSGKQEISNTVMVSADKSGEAVIAVYPNPFNDEMNIHIDASSASTAQIHITDITGKNVLIVTPQLHAGVNTIQTEGLASLSKGVYFVQVNVNGEISTYKLVKQ